MNRQIVLSPSELKNLEFQIENVVLRLTQDRAAATVEQREERNKESAAYIISIEPVSEGGASSGKKTTRKEIHEEVPAKAAGEKAT